MADGWKWVEGYWLQRNGKKIFVSGHWRWIERSSSDLKSATRESKCPACKAKIETRRGGRGGWVHFEFGMGKFGTLHPCFTIGRDMSKKLSKDTPDLFNRDCED